MKKLLFLLFLIPACGFAQTYDDATLLAHDSTQIKQLGPSQLRSWQLFKEVIQSKLNVGTTFPYWPLGGSKTLTNDVFVTSPNHTYSITLGSFGSFLSGFTIGSDAISLRQSAGSPRLDLDTNGVTFNVGSDATGDTYYRDGFGKFNRLAIGGTNKYMTVAGGIPVWSTNAISLGGNFITASAFNVPADASGVLTNNGSGTLTWGAAGITNTAANNEIPKSNGTNLIPSGISSTSSGNITTGAWQATVIAGLYGGTGVANSGKTITLGGNFQTSGAFTTTLTATGTTNLTLPTSGTLLTTSGLTISTIPYLASSTALGNSELIRGGSNLYYFNGNSAGVATFGIYNADLGTASNANLNLVAGTASTNISVYNQNNSAQPNLLRIQNAGAIIFRPSSLGLGISSTSDIIPDRLLHIEFDDATTNAIAYLQRLTKTTSGTGAIGIGIGIEFEAENASGNNRVGATIESPFTNVTNTTEAADLVFKTMVAGATASEKFRISSLGEIGLSGTNYGSAGQFFTSSGSGAAVGWTSLFPLTSSQLKINNPAATFAYTIIAQPIAANRNLYLPLTTATDTLVSKSQLDALTITTPIALNLGGTHADLSATGGAGQYLKQNSVGANITVSAVAESELTFTDITTNNVSITKHGFAPKAPNDATKYLDGTGAYSVPAGGGGGWAVTGNTNLTGAVTITESTTNTVTFLTPGVGATFTRGFGLAIKNATNAALGAQQHSGIFSQIGSGWGTTGSAPQEVAFHTRTLPIQGTTPTGQWVISSQLNGGTVNDRYFFTDDGSFSTVNGSQGVYLNSSSNSIDFGSGAAGVIKTNGSTRMSMSSTGVFTHTKSVASSGNSIFATWTGSANTNQTASTEELVFVFDPASTQYATGAMTQLRSFLIKSPTVSYVGSSVTTDMASMTLDGASISGTNAIGTTNTHGLWIKSNSVITGTGTATNSYGLTANAQSGATNNYSAQFLGGRVGVGLSAPLSTLDVSGSAGFKVTVVSTDLTLDDTYYTVLVDASGANRTITLPAVAGVAKRVYIVKKTDSSGNSVTLDGNASETIDGALTKVVNTQYSGWAFQANAAGTAWFITATF